MTGIPHYTQTLLGIYSYPIDVIGLGSNTIVSSVTTITPAGMTVVSDTIAGSRVYTLIKGGIEGGDYRVSTLITISNGEARTNFFDVHVTDSPGL